MTESSSTYTRWWDIVHGAGSAAMQMVDEQATLTDKGERAAAREWPMIHAVSSGGGVQSTALLVLTAQGEVNADVFLMANVGDRAENPATIAYTGQHAIPYARRHGIEFVVLRWVTRQGVERDLYDDLLASERDIPIPVRLGSGDFANRKCTSRYKIEVVARELKRRGATVEEPAAIALGISTDEIERASPGVPKQQPWTRKYYPLLDLGLSRADCVRIVADAGLPPAPKSSCWFCPYQGLEQRRAQQRNHPVLFAKAEALEDVLNERRAALGRDRIGLLSARARLSEAVGDQLVLDGMDDCDSGWCMT